MWSILRLFLQGYLDRITRWAIEQLGWQEAYRRIKDQIGTLPTGLRQDVWGRAQAAASAGASWNWLDPGEKPERDRIPRNPYQDHAYEVTFTAIMRDLQTGRLYEVKGRKGLDRLKSIDEIEDDIRNQVGEVWLYEGDRPDFFKNKVLVSIRYEAVWRKWA